MAAMLSGGVRSKEFFFRKRGGGEVRLFCFVFLFLYGCVLFIVLFKGGLRSKFIFLDRNVDVTLVCDQSGQPPYFSPTGEVSSLNYVSNDSRQTSFFNGLFRLG